MSSIFTRSITPELDHVGRRLEGIAYRFDHPSLVSDNGGPLYLEEFARACADRSLQLQPRLAVGILHPWSEGARTSPVPIGAVEFHKAAEALMFRALISRTVAGDEALELVKDGGLGDVSIGAKGIRQSYRQSPRGRVKRREEIAIRELSLAPPGMGLHEDAKVLAIRAETQQATSETPLLDAYRRRALLL